jgi:hypothetical protein
MNYRIKNISNQAANYADIETSKSGEFYPVYTEKFVELLIKECGSLVNDKTLNSMMEHFGIKQ